MLTAAAAGQFAHEGLISSSGARHGVFTWAVLDALRNGDTNGNGLIELSELVRHVQSVVPKVAAGVVPGRNSRAGARQAGGTVRVAGRGFRRSATPTVAASTPSGR